MAVLLSILSVILVLTLAMIRQVNQYERGVLFTMGKFTANMAQAAKTPAASPGALHLRTLQSINDLSSDALNTTVWMVPIEALKALEGLTKHFAKK